MSDSIRYGNMWLWGVGSACWGGCFNYSIHVGHDEGLAIVEWNNAMQHSCASLCLLSLKMKLKERRLAKIDGWSSFEFQSLSDTRFRRRKIQVQVREARAPSSIKLIYIPAINLCCFDVKDKVAHKRTKANPKRHKYPSWHRTKPPLTNHTKLNHGSFLPPYPPPCHHWRSYVFQGSRSSSGNRGSQGLICQQLWCRTWQSQHW